MEKIFFDKYFNKKTNIENIKLTADVVVDTNVLLAAYQWKEVTLKEVTDVMHQLLNDNRLRIPSHVFNEFIDQRPKRIADIIQKIDNELLNKVQKPSKLVSVVPFLEMLPDSNEYLELEKELLEIRKRYHEKTKELINTVRSFFDHDLVLDMFQTIIQQGYYGLDDVAVNAIEEEAKERAKKKQPPLTGGDNGKKENSYGDYYIWKQILSLDNDVLFITADKKEDWVLKDHHGNVLSPRRELVEEFYEVSGGKSFFILTPKQFVELFKPQVSEGVSKDLEEVEKEKYQILTYFIRDVLLKSDPGGLFFLTEREDEYDSEVNEIMKVLPMITRVNQLTTAIHNIFEENLGGNVGKVEDFLEISERIFFVKEALDRERNII
ncbi:PIN domain-containing protein [Paenibacillus amylolyticus]|uniref:PIN domain-containing protein n=1 Tax=Paenibacillus amylolyticus TaxID=1451 RepID=UPI003F7DB4FF